MRFLQDKKEKGAQKNKQKECLKENKHSSSYLHIQCIWMNQFEFYHNDFGVKQFIIHLSFIIQVKKDTNHVRDSLQNNVWKAGYIRISLPD